MTINKIVLELCKREGLKKKIDIAQMREIVGHLSDMIYEDFEGNIVGCSLRNFFVLFANGRKRAKKKAKGKKK